MNKRVKIIPVLALLAIPAFLVAASLFFPANLAEGQNEYLLAGTIRNSMPHDPISIDGDSELDAFFSGNLTDGSAGNPHVLAGLEISGNGTAPCISIQNTTRYLLIVNNTFLDSGNSVENSGIYLYNSSNINLTNNTLSGHPFGAISLSHCTGITVENNTMDGGGLFVWGEGFTEYNHSIREGNTVAGKTIHYSISTTGETVAPGHAQVFLVNSTGATIANSSYHYVVTGVLAFNSSSLSIKNVSTSNTSLAGIFLKNVSNSEVNNSSAVNGTLVGILAMNAHNVTLTNISATGCNTAASLINGSKINVSGCLFKGSVKSGVEISWSTGEILIENSTVTANGEDGINLYGKNNGTSINGNYIAENGRNGVNLQEVGDTIVINNVISNNTQHGIFLTDSAVNSSIHGNKITYNNNGSIQGHDAGTGNSWDDGDALGNYWSDYTTRYPGASPVGPAWSIPYELEGGAFSTDNFPLTGEIPFVVSKNGDTIMQGNGSTLEIHWILHDAVEGGHYAIYQNNTMIEGWTPWANQSWNVSLTIEGSDSAIHEYVLAYNNSQGLWGANSSILITVDNMTPSISGLDESAIIINGSGYMSSGEKIISFDLDDEHPGAVNVTVGATTVLFIEDWTDNKTVEVDLSGIAQGLHELVINASDAAGNIVIRQVSLLIDEHPPSITMVVPATIWAGDLFTISINASDAIGLQGGSIRLTVNGSVVHQSDITSTGPLSESIIISLSGVGRHVIELVLIDGAGNIAVETTTVEVLPDLRPPITMGLILTVAIFAGLVAMIFLLKYRSRKRTQSRN